MIPEKAVEAAHALTCPDPYHLGPICDATRSAARASLEAEAPWVVDWSQVVPEGMTLDEWLDAP